ncbi:MAG TPA: hypothetical protein VMR49_01865 [Candidatus Paceibacterota bacterium]|nr:hypothetical protein [Candidatus Paceibacterota bacterium]
MNKKTVLIIIGVAVVVGAICFYAGSAASKSSQSAKNQNTFANSGNFAGRGMRNGNNFTGGTVISKDSTSITVQARDGSSKVVFFTASTPIMKMVSGTSGDIAVGGDITITGTANPDGSISAESIQLRPAASPAQK